MYLLPFCCSDFHILVFFPLLKEDHLTFYIHNTGQVAVNSFFSFSFFFSWKLFILLFFFFLIYLILNVLSNRRGSYVSTYEKSVTALANVTQLIGASFSTPKGCRFNSLSGHMPRLWVQSPVGVSMGGNQLISLSLSLSLTHTHTHTHTPSSLSKINKHTKRKRKTGNSHKSEHQESDKNQYTVSEQQINVTIL